MFCAFMFKIYIKPQNVHVVILFLHLVPPFIPHSIIKEKGY